MVRSCYCFFFFWKTKVWNLHFQQNHSSKFCYDGVYNKKRFNLKKHVLLLISTAWKLSKYGVISSPYFPAFGLNTERCEVSFRNQCEWGKIRTRNNSVFGHFSRSVGQDLGLYKNKKLEFFSRKETSTHKVFVVLKLSAFCFEINSFFFPGCWSVFYYIFCSWYVVSKAWPILLQKCWSTIFRRSGLVSKIGASCIKDKLQILQNTIKNSQMYSIYFLILVLAQK